MSRILLWRTQDSRLPTLESVLLNKGYQVDTLLDVTKLQNPENTSSFDLSGIDLTIIDVSCGLDGASCCRTFVKGFPNMPLMLLVSEDASVDPECQRLTCGNVLQLPFTPRKVINRVQKLLDSRYGSVLQVGDLTLNLATRCVHRRDTIHQLTPKQAKLLQVFMQHSGHTLTRRFLMETVWNTDYMGDTRTLDVHVRWIRERIEEEPSHPKYLRTVRGIGYRFAPPTED